MCPELDEEREGGGKDQWMKGQWVTHPGLEQGPRREGKAVFKIQQTWVKISAPSLTMCVTLNKSPPDSWVPLLKNRDDKDAFPLDPWEN